MNLIGLCCCVLSLLLPAAGWAVSPQDFAYGREIRPGGEAGLQRVALPETVYRRVVFGDLRDLRVFNASGEPVPHAVSRPEPEPGDVPEPATLPVFALYTAPDGALTGRRIRVVTDRTGAVVTTETEAVEDDDAQRLGAYLIDLSGLRRMPNRLRLRWHRSNDAGFAVSVDIDASENLDDWDTLVRKATLAELRSGADELRRSVIDLPPTRARYLRIRWPEALDEVTLEKVVVEFPSVSADRRHHWLDLQGTRHPERPEVLELDSKGSFPVDRVRVRLLEDNTVVHGKLLSRTRPEDNWQLRHRGVYYKVRSNDEVVTNTIFDIDPTSDRYWRLEWLSGEDAVPPSDATILELGWVPHELTFLAQGPPPYTLAYGNAYASSPSIPVAALLDEIDGREGTGASIDTAQLGAELQLGGTSRLQPPPAPWPWKSWLLWLVLILGVGLLAWMVVRLLRELNREPPKNS